MKKTLLALAGASLLSVSAQAEQFWADNSVSVLYGSTYAEPIDFTDLDKDYSYSTMTLEHVSGHSWGGLFYFMDSHTGDGFNDTYFEFSPKFTLAKMDGMVSAVNAEFTYEGGNGFDNYLAGVGVDLKVPGMDFASVIFYRALNDKAERGEDNDDNQITLVYGYTNGNVVVDGFLDYAFGSDDDSVEDSMNFTPQITYNLAPQLGFKNKFKVGVEYSYWTSKYGIDGLDQNAISLLLKAHL